MWTGFIGAPGYTNWMWQGTGGNPPLPDDITGAMATFFDAIKAYLPLDVTVQVQQGVGRLTRPQASRSASWLPVPSRPL